MTESAVVPPSTPTVQRETGGVTPTMSDLRDHYVRRVNEAAADDRADLIRELNETYVEEALGLILATA